MLSSQLCNQRYKKNCFPLVNNSSRALSHYSKIENEQPVFIHPANEECETFITFREEIPIAGNGNERGIENISKLRLDGELLNEQRRKTFNMIRDIYDLAIRYPDTYPDLQQQARNLVNRYLYEVNQIKLNMLQC